MAAAGFFGLINHYHRHARLIPAVLILLPPLLTIAACFPDLLFSSIGILLLAIVLSCLLLYAVARFARSQGMKTEDRLLLKWGARPTTLKLRHRSDLDPVVRARYHRYLAENIPYIAMPSPEMEAAEPARADQRYVAAIDWLKLKTKGKEFSLVESESYRYGFRRSLRGLKPYGVTLCVGALLLSGLVIVTPTAAAQNGALWAATALDIIALLSWLFVVRDDWVLASGNRYATALLSACDYFDRQPARSALRPPESKAAQP
jgi:hypothetical protein